MHKIMLAALGLLLAPASAQDIAVAQGVTTPQSIAAAQVVDTEPAYTEGQSHADYLAWLAHEPAAKAQMLSFHAFLDMAKVGDIIPAWELVRTASMWRDCAGPRFEVPPFGEWHHIAKTLNYVKNHIQPVIGKVAAVSAYRNETLNQCAGGARESAHRHYYALDLVPLNPIDRAAMIRSLCFIHTYRGQDYDIGLGFYNGTRFHVDSKGFRLWGADGTRATSPCNG